MTKTLAAMLDDRNIKANYNSIVNGHPTWRRKVFLNELLLLHHITPRDVTERLNAHVSIATTKIYDKSKAVHVSKNS